MKAEAAVDQGGHSDILGLQKNAFGSKQNRPIYVQTSLRNLLFLPKFF